MCLVGCMPLTQRFMCSAQLGSTSVGRTPPAMSLKPCTGKLCYAAGAAVARVLTGARWLSLSVDGVLLPSNVRNLVGGLRLLAELDAVASTSDGGNASASAVAFTARFATNPHTMFFNAALQRAVHSSGEKKGKRARRKAAAGATAGKDASASPSLVTVENVAARLVPAAARTHSSEEDVLDAWDSLQKSGGAVCCCADVDTGDVEHVWDTGSDCKLAASSVVYQVVEMKASRYADA